MTAASGAHPGSAARRLRAAVVGAGIGGLCAAIGLQRAGLDVTVFERAEALRQGGSGLAIFGNGMRALDEIGVGDAVRQRTSTAARQFRAGQRKPDGAWLATIPGDAVAELCVIDRTELHRLLVSALENDTIQLGVSVVAAHASGELQLRHADRVRVDDRFGLIVAADGLRSAIRATWPEDPGIRYAGYSAWRAITQHPVDVGGEAGETWGDRCRFGVVPLADGRVYWFAVATMPADATVADEMDELTRRFGTWHAPIPELLRATAPERVQRLPIEELAGRLPSFCQGRVVLLGDAAHAMTPDLGQGGGQAMEDAATLARLVGKTLRAGSVTGPGDGDAKPFEPFPLDAAIATYDALRRRRSQRIAERSRLVGKLAHVPGPVLTGLRDVLLRMTPERVMRRQLDEIGSWQPPHVVTRYRGS